MDNEVKDKLFKLNTGRWNTGQVLYFEARHFAQLEFEQERRINKEGALRVFREQLEQIDAQFLKYVWRDAQ